MPKGDPPVDIQSTLYEAWIQENPKTVEGGPLSLISNTDPADNDDSLILPDYKMESDILPPNYAEKLIIHGHSTEYEGFNLWVTVKGYDYLLMAHKTHYGNPFTSTDGIVYHNHPHFHELDLYKPRHRGEPAKRYKVPKILSPAMSIAELLEEFMKHYYIDDGRTENVKNPNRTIKKRKQKGLNDEY